MLGHKLISSVVFAFTMGSRGWTWCVQTVVRNKMMEDLPELGRQGVCPMKQGTGVHPDDRQGRKEEGGGGGGAVVMPFPLERAGSGWGGEGS